MVSEDKSSNVASVAPPSIFQGDNPENAETPKNDSDIHPPATLATVGVKSSESYTESGLEPVAPTCNSSATLATLSPKYKIEDLEVGMGITFKHRGNIHAGVITELLPADLPGMDNVSVEPVGAPDSRFCPLVSDVLSIVCTRF